MATHDMTASEVVSKLRAQVEEHTGMTISAGIAPNRMLAKVSSVWLVSSRRSARTRTSRTGSLRSSSTAPPSRASCATSPSGELTLESKADGSKIPGFGRVTERCLEGLGVETCGDIYKHRAELLVMNHWFGFRGLCKAYLGIADNTVEPHKRGERKSVGVER
jgi:DNA polymerase kappa